MTKGAGSLVLGIFQGIYIVAKYFLFVKAALAKSACFNGQFDRKHATLVIEPVSWMCQLSLVYISLYIYIYIYPCVSETVHYFISV